METKVVRDLGRLKQEGTASAREVREFIGRMRGKSPQEVLGAVAQSNLIHGVIVATIGTALVTAVFTVGPYLLRDKSPGEKPAPAATAETKPAEQPATAATKVPAPSASPDETAPDKKILEKLEMDEVKVSDPAANPLENKDDDLLKELR